MSEAILDPTTIASLLDSVGGDREFLGELFTTFMDEAPALLASIELAVKAGDAAGLRHAAHTLKSTSASLGALKLAELSRELEQLGSSGAASVTPEQLDELRGHLDGVLEAMRAATEGAG